MRKRITAKIRATLIPRLSDVPVTLLVVVGFSVAMFGGYMGDWDYLSRFIVFSASIITVGSYILSSVKQPDKTKIELPWK